MIASLDRHLDEELLWSKELLDSQSPKSLLATIWFVLTQHFDNEAAKRGVEYITNEKIILQKRVRAAFAKTEERRSRKYLQMVGQDVQSSFYRRSCHIDSRKWNAFSLGWLSAWSLTEVWYKRQSMRTIYNINSFKKSMAGQAEMSVIEGKRLTNQWRIRGPLFCKKEEMTERRKTSRVSKSNRPPNPPPPSLTQGLDLPLQTTVRMHAKHWWRNLLTNLAPQLLMRHCCSAN